jgi:hypothetical protein
MIGHFVSWAEYIGDYKMVFESSLRFTNITIPQGSAITSAKITLTTTDTSASSGTPNLDIQAFDEDNSTQISTAADFEGRARTTANVNWSQSFSNNTAYETPDISSVVQEIVDRASWASGNAMHFVISDHTYKYSDLPSSGENWVAFDNDTTTNISITIEYYIDIGLRIRTSGSVTRIIGGKTLDSSHKLRFRNGATTYGIPLIATGGADDSGIRIYDGAGVKTVPKI